MLPEIVCEGEHFDSWFVVTSEEIRRFSQAFRNVSHHSRVTTKEWPVASRNLWQCHIVSTLLADCRQSVMCIIGAIPSSLSTLGENLASFPKLPIGLYKNHRGFWNDHAPGGKLSPPAGPPIPLPSPPMPGCPPGTATPRGWRTASAI
jgi:hypothetical protein